METIEFRSYYPNGFIWKLRDEFDLEFTKYISRAIFRMLGINAAPLALKKDKLFKADWSYKKSQKYIDENITEDDLESDGIFHINF